MVSGRFSDRIGVTQPRTVLQIDDIDPDLRISLWNLVLGYLEWNGNVAWDDILRMLGKDFFKVPVDSVPIYHTYEQGRNWFRERVTALKWFEVYNLVEFMVKRLPLMPSSRYERDVLTFQANIVLQSEGSAYRFVSGELVPLSNATEVQAIEEACQAAAAVGLDGVRIHLAGCGKTDDEGHFPLSDASHQWSWGP